MKKADYSKIASTYDLGRPISEQSLEMWLQQIKKAIGNKKNIHLLDLGCGTGRFTIPFAVYLGYDVTGADNSREMLDKAKNKDQARKVKWDIQNAEALTYPVNQFDVVFMSHLLHHIDHPLQVIKECFRVLKPKGILFNRYGAIEDILRDPEHRFFPKTVEIDEKRTPTKKQVEEWFKESGFINIKSTVFLQKTWVSPYERWERNKLKPTSVLALIPVKDFQKGIADSHHYILKHPESAWVIKDKLTLTSGIAEKNNYG